MVTERTTPDPTSAVSLAMSVGTSILICVAQAVEGARVLSTESARSLRAMDALAQRIRGLQKRSREISRIVGLIDVIAFQTHLLSLNASMLYLGTASGAIVGGALASSLGFQRLGWAGVPFVAAALALLWLGPTFTASTTVKERLA